MSRKTYRGFDYKVGQAVELSRVEWRLKARKLLDAGGRLVKVRSSPDVLLVGINGKIEAEVYEEAVSS